MDAEDAGGARSRLLEAVPSPDGQLAAQILAACPTVDVVAGEPYFPSSLPAGALLIVERGFVILRVTPPRMNRSIITCDAGPGRVVLPPASEEVLFALVNSPLTVTRSLDELQPTASSLGGGIATGCSSRLTASRRQPGPSGR